ncbi:type II toxin-antitoxin system RelE family toxin [Methylomonas albis]
MADGLTIVVVGCGEFTTAPIANDALHAVQHILRPWRYRVGDYRLICQIQDDELIVLVVELGHRKDIYRDKY